MNDNADYRRAWSELHHLADQFRMVPYSNVPPTDVQLRAATLRLRDIVGDLQELLQFITANQ
jgi:hypothetical protein